MKHILRKKLHRLRWSAAVLAALTLMLSGCFDYQEEIVVHEDGTVEIRVITAILEQALPALKNKPELSFFIGAAAGPEKLQSIMPDTIKVHSASTVVENGWVHSDMHITAQNIQDFTGAMGSVSPSHSVRFWQNNDGTYELERIVVEPRVKEAFSTEAASYFLGDHLQKSKLKFELITPFKVLETNGFKLTDNRIRWTTNMAQVHRLGLRLWAKFDQPPLAYRLTHLPKEIYTIAALASGLLLALVGGLVFWRKRAKASNAQ